MVSSSVWRVKGAEEWPTCGGQHDYWAKAAGTEGTTYQRSSKYELLHVLIFFLA